MKRIELLVIVLLLGLTAMAMGRAPVNGLAGGPEPTVAAPTLAQSREIQTAVTLAATAAPSPTNTLPPTVTPKPTDTPAPTATVTATPSPEPTRAFDFDTRPDLDRYFYVDQLAQRMYVFEHGELVRDMPCSTGLPGDTTFTVAWEGTVGHYWGTFTSFGVWADDAWYLYPCLGTILVHSLPYVWQNGYKVYLERDALGVRPASHGCIRLSPEDATWLTEYNPQGVLMTINDPHRDHWFAVLGERAGE